MRDEWHQVGMGMPDSRRVVVFRVRCSECRRAVGEYQVEVPYRGAGRFYGGGGSLEQRLATAGHWVRFDPRDYTVGLSNHSEDGNKTATTCTHTWPSSEDGLTSFQASDLRKGLAFLRRLAEYDTWLEAQQEALGWDAELPPDPVRRPKDVANWHEIGVRLDRSPTP